MNILTLLRNKELELAARDIIIDIYSIIGMRRGIKSNDESAIIGYFIDTIVTVGSYTTKLSETVNKYMKTVNQIDPEVQSLTLNDLFDVARFTESHELMDLLIHEYTV